jgi:hypothetical protein
MKKIIADIKLELPEDKKAEIALKNIDDIPFFYMIGNGKRNHKIDLKGYKPMDGIDKLLELGKYGRFAFKCLKSNLKPAYDELNNKYYTTCYVEFVASKELSSTDRVKFQKGLKELIKEDIVRKTNKRSLYMINPNLLIPKYYQIELADWNSFDK